MQTPAIMQRAFIHGMSSWAGNDDGMFEWDPDAYPSVAVNQALVVQTQIGWNRVCQGFLASEWQHMYTQAAARSGDGLTQQKNWTSTVYSAMFNFFSRAWIERNGALHGIDQKESEFIKRDRLLRKVDAIFSVKGQLLVVDRLEIFKQSRNYFQTCSIFELKNYVMFAEAIIPSAISRSAELPVGQTTITQYFTRRTPSITMDDPGSS
jgi:hypothetical protein